MITCEAAYPYPGKQTGNAQPFSESIPLARITQLVKSEKYMADTDYFIPGAVAILSLVWSVVSAMMYKNSRGKFLVYANYGKSQSMLTVMSLYPPTESFWHLKERIELQMLDLKLTFKAVFLIVTSTARPHAGWQLYMLRQCKC